MVVLNHCRVRATERRAAVEEKKKTRRNKVWQLQKLHGLSRIAQLAVKLPLLQHRLAKQFSTQWQVHWHLGLTIIRLLLPRRILKQCLGLRHHLETPKFPRTLVLWRLQTDLAESGHSRPQARLLQCQLRWALLLSPLLVCRAHRNK